MAKLTKRMRVIRDKVDVTKQYDINEAVALLKELATAKFVEAWTLPLTSVSMHVNLTKRSWRDCVATWYWPFSTRCCFRSGCKC